MSQTKRLKTQDEATQSQSLISPLLRMANPESLTHRLPHQNTLPIQRYGLITIQSSSESSVGHVAIVSIPHNQILYSYGGGVGLTGPALPCIMGRDTSEVLYHLGRNLKNEYNAFRLMQRLLLESNDSVSLRQMREFIVSLEPNPYSPTYQQDEKVRKANKHEFKRLLNLVDQQPTFDPQRDSVTVKITGGPTYYRSAEWVVTLVPSNSPQTTDIIADANLPVLPTDVHQQISRHLADNENMSSYRLVCKSMAHRKKISRKWLRFHTFSTVPVDKLVYIISRTASVKLNLAERYFFLVAGDEDTKIEWDEQQMAWPILLSDEIVGAFATLTELVLEGHVSSDEQLFHFVSKVLRHPACKIRRIDVNCFLDQSVVVNPDATFVDALAKNRTVKEFILNGIYTDGRSLLKTWMDGIAQRDDLELFHNSTALYKQSYQTPSKVLINILQKNWETLKDIEVVVHRQWDYSKGRYEMDELDEFFASKANSAQSNKPCKNVIYKVR
jgi:hypothetical protein